MLRVGDEILSVNNVDVTRMTRLEAWNFMKKLNDGSQVTDPVQLMKPITRPLRTSRNLKQKKERSKDLFSIPRNNGFFSFLGGRRSSEAGATSEARERGACCQDRAGWGGGPAGGENPLEEKGGGGEGGGG